MRKILLICCLGVILSACGTASRSTIEIKYDGKEIPFVENQKASWQTVQKAIYGSGAKDIDQNHALRWITIRNYDFDATKISPNNDKLTAPDQVKIFLSLHDDAGTSIETPVKPAIYKAGSLCPMCFELINVYVFRDGKEERLYLYPSQQKTGSTAEVKITAVDSDIVSGEINVAGQQDGKEFLVKGPFTAQIYKR